MLGVRPKRERICRLILLGICFLQLACLGLSITYFTGRHSNAARDDFKSGEMSSTIPCQDYWCDSFAGTEVQTHRTHSLSLSPFFFLLFSRSSLFSHLVSLSLSHLVSLFSLPSLPLSRPVSERERDRK